MTSLRLLTCVVAFLLGAGEIARWWGQPRFVPLALDELLVAGAMLWAAVAAKRAGREIWLVGAWGIYCGFVLALLVPTLDHLLGGPPKPSAVFYSAILSAMLAVGLWALLRAVALIRGQSPRQ